MRAILYSRNREEENQPGLSQLGAMRAYAKLKGYQVIAEMTDEGSANTLDRPQIDRIRRMARLRQCDVLIVYSVDRLSRRMGQLAALREELAKHHVSIEYVLTQTDESIESRVMQQMMEAFADYEREKIHERTLRGLSKRWPWGLKLRTAIADVLVGLRRLTRARRNAAE